MFRPGEEKMWVVNCYIKIKELASNVKKNFYVKVAKVFAVSFCFLSIFFLQNGYA